MKFEIQQEVLQKSLDLVSGIVPSKTTLPILRCILVEAGQDDLRFSVTNLDVSMVTSVTDVSVAESGKAAITSDKLTSFVRSLAPGNVVFSVEDNKLKISSGKASCEVPCNNPEEYPSLPVLDDRHTLKVSGDVLGDMIAETSYAVSRDETRPALMGVLWDVSGDGLTMVATDAHRLSRSGRSLTWGRTEARQMIVDTTGLRQLARVIAHGEQGDEVIIFPGDNQLSFQAGSTVLHARLMEGPFPDYNAVIPKSNDKLVTVDREGLAQAVRRVSILADRMTNQIRVNLAQNSMTLSARAADGGHAEDELTVSYDGEDMEIGFNFTYLLDVLKNIRTETVQLSLRDNTSAALLVPVDESGAASETLLCLLMPLRLAGD